jgi:hypothetical protein
MTTTFSLDSLNSGAFSVLCGHLDLKSVASLKRVCKKINENVKYLVTIHFISCVVDENRMPIPDKNCFKLIMRKSEKELAGLDWNKFFYEDPAYKCLAVIMWPHLFPHREDSFFDDNHHNNVRDFLSTNKVVQERVPFEKEGRKVTWIVGQIIDTRIVDYMQKEIRYIQSSAWLCPYSYTTRLELTTTVDGVHSLSLICLAGKILEKTIVIVENQLRTFNISFHY